jgi:hypothetical protein
MNLDGIELFCKPIPFLDNLRELFVKTVVFLEEALILVVVSVGSFPHGQKLRKHKGRYLLSSQLID